MKKAILTGLAVLVLAPGAMRLHAQDAAALWTQHCASCHGKDGKGQTKAGRMAKVKDLTDAAYMAGFKDDQIFQDIKNGSKSKDGKEQMKPFQEKLTDEQIRALVAFVRGLK